MFNLKSGIRTAVAAEILIALTALFAPCAGAQSFIPNAPIMLPGYMPTHANLQGERLEISAQAMNRIMQSARKDSPLPSSDVIMQAMSSKIAIAVKTADNTSWNFASNVAIDSSASLMLKKSVAVEANYEARPVGGILNVTVSLKPAFSGVGVRNRPISSESTSEVIEEVSTASIQAVIADLTTKLLHSHSILASARS